MTNKITLNLETSQKSHLLNLTTKAKTSRKQQTTNYLFIHAQVRDGNNDDHDVDIFLNHICKNNNYK